jgi:HD-GYP domain-containing protein (c-di-GMP phosphodiesterase class II)
MGMIEKDAGTHFDPTVAAAALRLFHRGEWHVEALPSDIRQLLPMRGEG